MTSEELIDRITKEASGLEHTVKIQLMGLNLSLWFNAEELAREGGLLEWITLHCDTTYGEAASYVVDYDVITTGSALVEAFCTYDSPDAVEAQGYRGGEVDWAGLQQAYEVLATSGLTERALLAAIACDVPLGRVAETISGPHTTDAHFARDHMLAVHDLSSLPQILLDNIDWDGVADRLMPDYAKSEGYYFRIA